MSIVVRMNPKRANNEPIRTINLRGKSEKDNIV